MRLYLKQARFTWLAATLTCMVWSSSADADSPTSNLAIGVSGGLEHFHLEEFSGNGSSLLTESGYRYVITALLDNRDRYDPQSSLLYHLEAAAYWGQVDYNGLSQSVDPTQSNLPFNSQTDYQGGRGEASLGYRFKPSILPRGIEVLGGIGLDAWSRRIKDGTTINGTPVSGIKEEYQAYYGKIALGMTDLIPFSWRNHLQVGLKMPFNINEDVKLGAVGYDSDVSVSPGNSPSGFIKLVMESRPDKDKPGNLLISIYYDGFRFDPSSSKTVTRNGNPIQVWQPETHIDIIGVQAGYRF